MDESSAEISRISDQVSLGLSGPESATTPATRPEVIRSIAAQMVTAAPRGTQPPVEIALNPEELGQVKMSVTTTDTSVVMTIAAERPETLDLMRRNLEQLTSEFRDLGYSDISFVFAGDGSDASGNSDGSHGNQNGSSAEQEQVALNETKTPSATSSGVDVRL
ncbi:MULTISPECIES: flagellar hook-length control protein FliK [Roseobacteraceae]|nr:MULTISPECIES: flagellar hook-length control protein FliK [Roseobacteraceae]MBT3141945.1 flagellar hook-length control protein FliK [Falsiruegeria litorea]MBT8168708.1 flagellar hook-length control protein FliK [Falsiruegeria litorea]